MWVDDGKEFLGMFKKLCDRRGVLFYSTFSEKSWLLLRETSDHLKIIHRYREENWAYCIDEPDNSVDPTQSWVSSFSLQRAEKIE